MVEKMVLKYTTFLFNIDGFLWNWKYLDKSFIKIFDMLIEHNRRIILLTNNSAYSKIHLTHKLREKGLRNVEEKHIFTSIDSLIYYLYKQKIKDVYIIGEYGLLKEIEGAGIEQNKMSNVVILGIDRTITYEKIRKAYNILKEKESLLIHLDNAMYWRIGNEEFPITLPLLSYFQTALINRDINKVFVGKPSIHFKEALLERYSLHPSTTVLISNNANDMKFAASLGIDAMLVNTNTEEILKKLEAHEKPKYVASDIIFVRDLM